MLTKITIRLIISASLITFLFFILQNRHQYLENDDNVIDFNTSKHTTKTQPINKQSDIYKTIKSGFYDFSLYHDKLKRNYKVYVPKKYNPTHLTPTIMAFHGGGGNMKRSPNFFQLNAKADQETFIVVYPEGIGVKIGGEVLGSWNGGDCCGIASDNNIDDVGFVKKMIAEIKQKFNIDNKRIFATGMSNGAIMSYRLACEMADQIAAIAPVASIGHYKNCHPSRPVPILHIHGLADPCAPYNGCTDCKSCVQKYLSEIGIKNIKLRYSNAISVPDYIDTWKKINGCSNKTRVSYKNRDAECKLYLNCSDKTDLELCLVENMGHVWPGKATYGTDACQRNPNGFLCRSWKETVGPTNTSLPANDLIWDFFKKHPMP